ncbi:DUF262 domain-containing protein [Asaia bogorensis]|uniref:DUF262 domain-containing protein n=1 Tax=Asaia bogorensis TaxID=91915 RepID=UPI00285571C9|nr:DUF262 domain-containing protein [Asaia bogorensis]MDR6183915.1 hypothetical protein [Asaia bogorensis NBRC 16594]
MAGVRSDFRRLLTGDGRVVIPRIQRDYVQGRSDYATVGRNFLSVLHDHLCLDREDPKLPLELDFIYGRKHEGVFQPLDGQQRLTTLFLLHWYLAWHDDEMARFKECFVADEKSRFGYDIRPSSREFIDALAGFCPRNRTGDYADVRDLILDQTWYRVAWRRDPTVQAALQMLQWIHEKFGATKGLFLRLVDADRPAIVFLLLDLQEFSLSDDLYIKMNARGKALRPFETFKARFETDLAHMFDMSEAPDFCGTDSVEQFFAKNIDTRWSDLFWWFSKEDPAKTDDAFMNLLRVVILVTRSGDPVVHEKSITALRDAKQIASYFWFQENDWLDREMALTFIVMLQRWCGEDATFDSLLTPLARFKEREALKQILEDPLGIAFPDLVQFSGYALYLRCAIGRLDDENHDDDSGIALQEFDDWMRIVVNLSVNTDYNRVVDMRRSVEGLRALAVWRNSILAYFAGEIATVEGFSGRQIAEERVKAYLVRFSKDWCDRIQRAESHPYFKGQIGFLLRFCGLDLGQKADPFHQLDENEVARLAQRFEHYLECATSMMDALQERPNSEGRLWERALLACGDFLLPSDRNHSLLVTKDDVSWSWKRLLRHAGDGYSKGMVLKTLWDLLPAYGDRTGVLDNIIITHRSSVSSWQRVIIDTPEVYGFSVGHGSHRMLRFVGDLKDKVFLLRKSQMNGWHAELFTWCAYQHLLRQKLWDPRTMEYRETTSSHEVPALVLKIKSEGCEAEVSLRLHAQGPDYECVVTSRRGRWDALDPVFAAAGLAQEAAGWRCNVDRNQIADRFLSLPAAFTRMDQKELPQGADI